MQLSKPFLRKSATILMALMLLFSAGLPAQVHRSEVGLGEALILPYWTTANGQNSLIKIGNSSERAVAVKLLWLNEHGEVSRSYNLYLDGEGMWSAGTADSYDVSFIGTWTEPVIIHPRHFNACLLPLELNADPDAGVTIFESGADHGSLEIIEMASVDVESPLAPEGKWIDCAALAERWNNGAWSMNPGADLLPPAGKLSASSNLISVSEGGMNTIEATALVGFSDVVQHTRPEVPTPDLSHAVDSEASGGGVRSAVCGGGHCWVDEWSLPVEAVAAALMTSAVVTDYSANPGLGADFDWLLHRPLDRYQALVDGFSVSSSPQARFYTRSGDRYVFCPPQVGCVPGSPPSVDETPFGTYVFPLELDASLHVLSMSREIYGGEAVSPILGHPIEPDATPFPVGSELGGDAFAEGLVRLSFDDQAAPLTAPAGRVYSGEPVIAVGFQQFTNGALPGGVLANYRGTEAPRYELTILEPE